MAVACLVCDGGVPADRAGNLLLSTTTLRNRVENAVGHVLDGLTRSSSLCTDCEVALETIEEYYQHLQQFQQTFAATALKYGEVIAVPYKTTKPAADEEQLLTLDGVQHASTWTFCLQTEDGSLVPLQSEDPLVMDEPQQVVLETVTVENNQVQGSNKEDSIDGTVAHPSIIDHTGMALSTEDEITRVVTSVKDEQELHIPDEPFACAHCDEKYADGESLVAHKNTSTHNKSYSYKCGVCGIVYERFDSLRDHISRHMGQKPHVCEICDAAFSYRNQLSKHRVQHYVDNAVAMTESDMTTWSTTRETPAGEETKVQEPDPLLIPSAESMTESVAQLNNDQSEGIGKRDVLETAIAVITGDAALPDNDEGDNISELPAHQNTDYMTDVQTFDIDNQEADHQTDVSRADHQETQHSCALCHAPFESTTQLEEHRKLCTEVSLVNARLFTCPLCYQTFLSKDSLQQHMRAHTGEVPCRCEGCGQMFKYRGQLSRHRTICKAKAQEKCPSTSTGDEPTEEQTRDSFPSSVEDQVSGSEKQEASAKNMTKDCDPSKITEKDKLTEEENDQKEESTLIAAEKLDEVPVTVKKRGRGRPRKYPPKQEGEIECHKTGPETERQPPSDSTQSGTETPPKRKRGRPPKNKPSRDANITTKTEIPETNSNNKQEVPAAVPVKRKRGRPRKIQVENSSLVIENKETVQRESEGEIEETAEKEAEVENRRPKRKRICPQRYVTDNEKQDSIESKSEESQSKSTAKEQLEKNECGQCKRKFSCLAALKKHLTSRIHLQGPRNEQKRFCCDICHQSFTRAEHLRDHSVVHSGQKPHVCVVCDRKFRFRSQLAKHRTEKHTKEEVREAMLVKPQFSSRKRGKLQRLLASAGDEAVDPDLMPIKVEDFDEDGVKTEKIFCQKCDKVFCEMRLFNRHIVSHYTVKPFKCDVCNRTFARADTLRTHRALHAGSSAVIGQDKLFLCDTCGCQFKRVDALRNHVKLHFGVRPWKCKTCTKGFADKYTLARHEVIHKQDKPWLCATCGKGFNRKNHLEAHEAQHRGIKLFECPVCSRGFAEQSNLRRHMAVHSEDRPWKCKICGEGFKRKANMEDHEATHSKEKRAKCDICGGAFTTERYLRIHKLIHTGDRPHKCINCGATFRHLSALITHKRVHTGHAPYKCAHCPRRYKYYDQWKAHEYGHVDAKPYKCMICLATFRQAGTLRNHRRTAHGNKKVTMVYLCSVCKKTFSSSPTLVRHMKRVHLMKASLQHFEEVPGGDTADTGNGEVTSSVPVSTSSIIQLLNPQETLSTMTMSEGTKSTADGLQVTQANINHMHLTGGQNIIQFVSNIDGIVEMSDIHSDAIVVQVPTSDGGVVSLTPLTNIQTGDIVHYTSTSKDNSLPVTEAQAVVEAVNIIDSAEQEEMPGTLTAVSSMADMASVETDQVVAPVNLVDQVNGSLTTVPAIATVETISSVDSITTFQTVSDVHASLAAAGELGTIEEVEFTNLAGDTISHSETLDEEEQMNTTSELVVEQHVGET